MPTTYKDQFYTIDPGSAPAGGTPVTVTRLTLTDSDDNGLIQPNVGDLINGVQVTSVWQNDTVTINVPGVGNVTYTGVTFYSSGSPVFTPTDGQVLQDGTFVSSTFVTNSTQTPVGSLGPTCFTSGTLIDTARGAVPIETLEPGDLIRTLDAGFQPVRWIGRETVPAYGRFAPVRFAAGAIGNTAPLVVSQQHRMLIEGWQAELNFAEPSILVAAKHLVNGSTVTCDEGGDVTYLHLLFDDHQIVFGGGVPSESYFPAHAVDRANAAARAEILALFPDLQTTCAAIMQTARPVIGRDEATLFAA